MRPSPSPPTTPPSGLSEHLDRRVAQLFFAGGGAVSLGGVATYGLLPMALETGLRPVLVTGCLLLALMFVLLCWRVASLPLARTVQVAAWAASAMTGLAALSLGTGVHSQVLGYWPLLISLVAVLASQRSAAMLTATCALMTAAMALNEVAPWLPVPTPSGGEGLLLSLVTVSLMLSSALVVGALVSLVVHRSLAEAREREQRFRELLGMSVDWYWELDAQLRFVHFEAASGTAPAAPADPRIGRTAWELSDFGLDDDEMDAHRADLESREPFSRLLLRRTDASGRPRIFSCSGKPRFSASGAFRGFWGVSVDITDEMTAQQAVRASETRYRELFERSPTPLVLHRSGRVLDANPAAATMCGVSRQQDMAGFDLLTLYRDEASRPRQLSRQLELDRLAVGEGLPVADFVLHSPTGQILSVHATAVRVMADGGPATLSIFFDVTARRAAEAALRRSEALLSHLFATSPGCITLTEMASGRYLMANPGFKRIAVADTGPGLDAATQRSLFRTFIQADASTTRRYGGTGLGLSICRELAHLMGGEVGVRSEPGRGSRFWAELALPAASPPVQEPHASELDLTRLRGAHVLMVEDNPVNMMISVAQLEQWGAEVGQACDGQLAIEEVDRAARLGKPFDVVLMDLQMPRMGGHEAARVLRARYTASELPIIALTAAALVSERQQALQAGMNDFVTKPIDPQQLLRALVTAL